MMNTKICMFDNGTGMDLPTKAGAYAVEIMLGSTINEIHNNAADCLLFGVVTHIPGIDFVVPTNEDKETLMDVFGFGGKDYTVEVKESSMWYNKKAKSNIVISDSVKMSAKDLALVLITYINKVNLQIQQESRRVKDVYSIIKSRNSEEVMKTPDFDEAIRICDTTPCAVVVNRAGEIVYKTRYGKISVSKTSTRSAAAYYKSRNPMSNGVFKIKTR